MRRRLILFLLPCILACGGDGSSKDDWSNDRDEDFAFPVRVEAPRRAEVEDYVETQATLETDRHVDIFAEVDGKISKKVRDLGDRVGTAANGESPFLLARIDDRDLALNLKDAEIRLKEEQGKIRELELAKKQAGREEEQARVALREAEAILKRTTSGIQDGTISAEEHERATFAKNLAKTKLETAQAAVEKSEVAFGLGEVAALRAGVARDRAEVSLEKATLRAPFAGIVTVCNVREGERVRTGDQLYRIEDPATLIIYGDIPVRQSTRVRVGNDVGLASTALGSSTSGKVILVSPTVDSSSGTVRVKVQVQPAQGFKSGLFVTLRIVVEKRQNALVVPKRAVLHDDEDGAYLFTVEEGQARRIAVKTGFQRGDLIEIVEGLAEGAQVVVEGQDTLAADAKVEIQAPR